MSDSCYNVSGKEEQPSYLHAAGSTLSNVWSKVKTTATGLFSSAPNPTPASAPAPLTAEQPKGKMGILCHHVSHIGTYCLYAVKKCWQMVYDYLFTEGNWKSVATLALIWTLILTGMGIIYGFSATFRPFGIGLISSFAFGIIVGGVMVKAFPKTGEKENQKYNTLISMYRSGLKKCEAVRCNSIASSTTSVVSTVALVLYPLAVALVLGFALGQHAAAKIGSEEENAAPAQQPAQVPAS